MFLLLVIYSVLRVTHFAKPTSLEFTFKLQFYFFIIWYFSSLYFILLSKIHLVKYTKKDFSARIFHMSTYTYSHSRHLYFVKEICSFFIFLWHYGAKSKSSYYIQIHITKWTIIGKKQQQQNIEKENKAKNFKDKKCLSQNVISFSFLYE